MKNYLPHTMSKIKIYPNDNFHKENFLSYVAQLGTRLKQKSGCATLSQYDVKLDVNNSSTYTLRKYSIIQQVCRKLDVLNVTYEVTE